MGLKFWEMIVLAIIVLLLGPHVLLLGPRRLAGLGEAVGKALRDRDATGSDVPSGRRPGAGQDRGG